MKLLVCGGREFRDFQLIYEEIKKLDPAVIIQGAARGADSLAGAYAVEHGLPNIEVAANWRYYKNSAGPIRNRWMLEYCQPDVVLAMPGGNGTANMVRIAKEEGIEVISIG